MPDNDVSVIPANEATWEDLQTVFGRGSAARCQCQRIKLGDHDWFAMPVEERAYRLREETDCGHPEADRTSGMVAYLDGEPVGWERLTRPLTAAAVEYARSRGAKAIEGYPMVPKPGQNVSWGEMNVGSRNTFVAAGFHEVSHPTTRRVVMRLDLD